MSFINMHLKTINVTLFLQGQTAAVINLCHLSECLMLENSFSNESHLLHCVCLFRSLQWKLLCDIHSMPGVSSASLKQTSMSVKRCTWKQS